MEFTEQLALLQAAAGDPAKLALATADLAFPALPPGERLALREALAAAAIAHWFDANILAVLLQITAEESRVLHGRLCQLTVVEPFPARGETAANVHEAARLALRKALAAERTDWFRTLSERTATHFANDPTPAARIEWIYHRLCSAPDEAASELERLDRDWSGTAHPEDREALAVALRELAGTGLIHARALVWASLCIAWVRVDRGETAQLGDDAHRIRELARDLGDARAESDAECLLGDVLKAQGKLGEAQVAFAEDLAISRRLVEQDPSNTGWQRELAVTHNRMGGVLQAQGKLDEAQAAFAEGLAINRRLAEQDPSNAGWQRGLAVAHNRVGGVLKAQGKLDEAQAAFAEDLAISHRLVEQDPSNAGWQRDLAVAHNRVGGVLQAQGKLDEAQASFAEGLAISRRLAEQDPSNADWQRDLAVAHRHVGGVRQAQGKLDEAQAAFAESLAISRRLAEQDPSNAGWQRDLAVAHNRVGGVLQAQDKLGEAQAAFAEALAISRRLTEQDPRNADWQRDLAVAHRRVGGVLQALGKLGEAQAAFAEALAISRQLAEQDPSNTG
jgi:tetratricopeptide (TPR) repeat protein